MPPPHFPQDQGIECMPIITSEKIKNVSIRFPKWTFDTKTVQYAECRVKWQKYNFMMGSNRINVLRFANIDNDFSSNDYEVIV